MKLKLILSVLLMGLVAQVNASKKIELTITVGGSQRSMIVYTPTTMKDNMPLMIVTHGMGQSPEYQSIGDPPAYTGGDRLWEMCDTAKFVVTYLRAEGGNWDIGGDKDLNFVKQTITEMKTKYNIDERRVYWSGFSMGSMLIYHCMSKMTDKIAAFVPTSGIQFSESPWNALKTGNLKVNLMAHHSNGDTVFPIDKYDVRSYVTNIALNTGCSSYSTKANYKSKEGDYKGMLQRWVNPATGNVVQLFMYDQGGHWPSWYNRKEIWAFCKQFSLPTQYEKYSKIISYANQLVELYANDPGINTKSAYKTLVTKTNTYALDKVDENSESAAKTAYTNLNSAINALETYVTSNSQKVTMSGFDPNLHIYLCFGQSNSEGNATPELIDYALADGRFLTMSAVSMTNHKRTKNNWYYSRPPLCRDATGLTPGDYFGRKLVEKLPDSIRVAVINVSLGGCAIEMFNEDGIADYIKQQASWLQSYAASYNNNPFRYLVNAAKKAQESGVIKGILLHQGCSNNGQSDWPNKVKTIYERLLDELSLNQDDCPLLVGELLAQDQGGACYGHNSVIAKVPSVISNAHVVSSKGCNGAYDGLHFTAAGYRKLGENYANVMYDLLERYMVNTTYSIKSMKAKETRINMGINSKAAITILLTDKAGVQHDVTSSCKYTINGNEKLSVSGTNFVSGAEEGEYSVTATYTNDEGEEKSVDMQVNVRIFPLALGSFMSGLINKGTFSVTNTSATYKATSATSMGGWHYDEGVDLSAFDSLVVELKSKSLAVPELRIYDTNDVNSTSYYKLSLEVVNEVKHFAVDLKNMQDAEGRRLDPSHIYVVGISPTSTKYYGSLVSIGDVYLCNTAEETGVRTLKPTETTSSNEVYDLNGRRVSNFLKKGVYIRNGKKIVIN